MATELSKFALDILANPCFGFVGTVNKSNQPVMTRFFGFKYENPLSSFTAYTFKKDAFRLVDCLTEEIKLSVAVTNALDFKTLQFKGSYLNHYDAPENELVYPRICNEKQVEIMAMFGISKEVFAKWNYAPSVAVVMNVNEIFDQTPKVGTGNKIN